MRRGRLDAIFIIAGFPVEGVKQLVEDGVGRVIGLSEELVAQITSEHLYMLSHSIPAGVYLNSEKIDTLGVSAQMIVRSDISAEVVYEVTGILWDENVLHSLAVGHPRGADISSRTALRGVSIPLHPGARRYYQEQGYTIQDVSQ